jgi:hypothetical protein
MRSKGRTTEGGAFIRDDGTTLGERMANAEFTCALCGWEGKQSQMAAGSSCPACGGVHWEVPEEVLQRNEWIPMDQVKMVPLGHGDAHPG